MTGARLGFDCKDNGLINNRQQNGRRRGRGGNNNGSGGGNPRQGGQGRGDSGNRIDNRARGNAAQLLEKYKNLASDAQRQGDRVNTEYYLQFADHYFRVLADQRGRFEEQQPQQRRPQNDFDMDGDEDYGDEGEPIRAGEQQGEEARASQQDAQYEGRQSQPRQNGRQDGYREGRQQNGRNQDRDQSRGPDRGQDRNAERGNGRDADGNRDRGEGRGWEMRDDRVDADDRQTRNDNSPRNDNAGRADREPRGRGSRNPSPVDRAEPQLDARTDVAGQHRSDPPLPGEEPGDRAAQVIEADAPTPRRRGRPRSEAVAVPSDEAAGFPASLDADRLPPSLGIAPAADSGEDAPVKPKRRRIARPVPDATAAE